MDLHSDAACAVVQSLGRFMASYFSNQPLYILPPHNVDILPPIHLPHGSNVGRLVPLCQEEVATAVRRQHLSEVWTVDYALDLLLLGGLLPEAVWLTYHLGDWKTAVSLSLAYSSYCTDHFDFSRLRKRELHLPAGLEAENIFQSELECLLSNKSDSLEQEHKDGDKSFSDPLEGEDLDLLQASIQEIFKASVMAGVNVMSLPLSSLLDKAKDLCSCLPALVPNGLYLPSPPLYCPQPSPNTQDPVGTIGQFTEVAYRHKVSRVLQKLLLLLRSARCCRPAAQWYITHLRRARHLLHKIKKKYSYPAAAKEERAFPEGLMKFDTRRGFFRRGPKKDGHLDPDTIQTIIYFRELCGLCWMLHVRDQLSISCRKYQAARQHGIDEQNAVDSEVRSSCVVALRWACRLLPFCRYLNAEEILQDILLSLVAELPPVSLVADTLVRAFPEEEESVRVPLREKYNSVLQRLRQCNVIEGEKDEVDELMMILIQDKYRQRRKHLGRLRRHLAPTELHLWEKEEEEDDRGHKHGMAVLRQLSLGTSLSTSTLTDCGFPPVCSDGDTAENTSEAMSPEQHCQPMTRDKKGKKVRDRDYVKKTAIKIESAIQEECQPNDDKEGDKVSLPVVGTREFELEDEEYLNFLELFLSYVLEKDSVDGGDSGSELPLLRGFSSQLRERELHSLTFDVLSTIHRRQRDGHHPGRKHCSNDPPVFRAGGCYKPVKQGVTPEPPMSSIRSEAPISRASLSVSSLPGLRAGRQKGLFGLRQQSSVPLAQRMKGGHSGSEMSLIQSAFPMGHPPEGVIFGSSTSVEAVTELQQGLDPKLMAQFPELGRLLEWMVRWADRRALLGHHGKKKKEWGGGAGGTADEGVVIRVKASAPAVLTSLTLLEWRYAALLSSDHIQVPETQWTVAPVLQPDVDRRLERESSVDTGYPGSANTPIIGLDQNVQQGELSIGSCTDDPEELTCHRTPPSNDQDQLTLDAQQKQSSSQKPLLDDLDVTPEKEDKTSDSEGFEVSSSVSHGNISENICTPQTSLKLADLDVSEKHDDTFSSTSLSLQAPPHPEPQALPIVQPVASIHAEPADPTEVLLPDSPVDPPSLQPQSSTAGAAIAASTAPSQPSSNQIPPLRQQLGEDLFRLVQNINYMSLKEVLRESFSNLQTAQQSSSMAQSNYSHPNVPSSHVTNFTPQPSVLPVQTAVSVSQQTQASVPSSGFNNPHFSQATASLFANRLDEQSPGKAPLTVDQLQITRNLPSTSSAGVNYQEMQPLSVQAESPEIHFKQSKRLIPSSQGLLATTDTSHTVAPSAPMALPHDGSIQNDQAPQVMGLKLLHLQRPPLPQQSACHPVRGPQTLHTANPAALELKHNYQAATQRAQEEQRNWSSLPRRQLSFNHPHDPALRNSQPQIQTSERARGQEFPLLPPAISAHTPASMQGLSRVHFEPVSHSNITFPKLHLPSSSRPSTVITVPLGETPVIKLLRIDSAPKISPVATPSNQMTRLMSMKELTSSAMGRQNMEESSLQLVRVDRPTENTRPASIQPSSNSSKRQRRRAENEKRARKTEVTFKPDESIIPVQEPTVEPVNEVPPVAENMTPGPDIPIPVGSFDSSLTGQRLLDKAMATSAELHAYASSCKRPPECHDAFTNTDPTLPPTLVDKAVSGSVTTTSPNSQSLQNLHSVQDRGETPKKAEKILDQHGRQFISVLDLEDKALHHDLPLCLSPEPQSIPPVRAPSPTSADLHALASAVITSAVTAAADPQPHITITDNLLTPITRPDIPVDTPLVGHIEPSTVPETITPQHFADPSDSEICRAIRMQSVGLPGVSSSPPTAWFSSRLSEMDAQLAALQKIADHLEMDFSNSRMLVNTIEKLTPVQAPEVKSNMAGKKTVRLTVPREAWTPRSDFVMEPNPCEEEGENQDHKYIRSDSRTRERSPCSPRAGPSYLHTPPKMKAELCEASGMSHVWEDETLGQTGLLDTAEILDELVKEGYLSLTDLDFSTSHTSHCNSRQHQSSRMSQRSALPEEDRRELRIWMRRKQRERLAAYQKHRESLREKEFKPFTPSGKAKSTNRNQATIWRSREEKEKFMLLEQYNRRTLEACSLASEFPITAQQPEGPPLSFTTQPTSTPIPGHAHRPYSAPANDKRSPKSQSGQTQLHLRPKTAEVQGRPLEDCGRRLGLHRPVTSLPRDRLSQVTRRGMITETKSHTKLGRDSQSEEQQRKTRINKSPSGWTERGSQREKMKTEDRTEVNPCEPKSELSRLLDLEESESNIVLAGLLDEQDDGARAGSSGMDWLDNLSESASSSLSKIDWAAIERMVAAEEG